VQPVLEDPKEDAKDADISKRLGYSRFLIDDPWVIGRARLNKGGVKSKRDGMRRRMDQKKRVNLALGSNDDKVGTPAMKLDGLDEVELPPWAKRMMETYLEYYK